MRLTSPLAAAALCWAALGSHAAEPDDLEQLLATPVYAASKYKQTTSEAPAAVTVLTQGDIRSFGWRTLGEVLNGVRGVFTRYDRTYTYLGVRGLSRPGDYSSRLLLLVDGVRANENIYDSVLVGREFPIDVALIERIEFIPGPGSVIYGPNAVLGVINVITRSAASLRGQVLTTGLDSQRAVKMQYSSALEFEPGSLLMAASAEHRPGADLDLPEIDPSGGNGHVHGLDGENDRKVHLRWSSGELNLSAIASERNKIIPNAPFDLVFGDRSVWTDRMTLFGGHWEHQAGDGRGWSVHAVLGQYDYHDFGRYEPDGYLTRYRNQGRWWQGELRHTWRASDTHLWLVGVDVQRNFRQLTVNATDEPARTVVSETASDSTRFGAFVTDEITLTPRLKWGIGLRADRATGGRSYLTPRSSLIWQPAPEWVLKALAGQAYREPNFFEKAPPDTGEPWNEALQRERVQSWELATDWRPAERLRLSASLFDSQVKELIEQRAEADGLLVYRNVGGARSRGIELEAEWIAAGGWRLRSSLTRQRVRLDDGSEPSNAPSALLKVHATAPVPGWPVRLGIELLGTGARRTLAGRRLGTQALCNATLNWDPPGRPWSWSASLYNLGNWRLADPAGPEFRADRIGQDGRVLAVRWTLTF